MIETAAPIPLEAFRACLARADDAARRGLDPESRDGYQAAIEAALQRCQAEICQRAASQERPWCEATMGAEG